MVKHFLAITITLLPSAALAEQFTPQQMLEVMTKSPSNRDVRVHDYSYICVYCNDGLKVDEGRQEQEEEAAEMREEKKEEAE